MADLLTLSEYKTYLGIDPTDNRDDAQITALLAAASQAVRSYTDRKFEIAAGATTRVFQYDGSGFLDIDDATAITKVETDAGVLGASPLYELDVQEYTPMPYRESGTDQPYYYLVIHSGRWLPASPEMGFERNMDRLGYIERQPLISVTATYGWLAIPEDVKLATAWTISSIKQEPQSDELSSEAISGFSRSWNRGIPTTVRLALPGNARDLLAPYVRVYA